MPDRATIIKNANTAARNDWVNFTVAQEQQIAAMLADAANDIIAQIERFTVEGKLPPARLTQLYANIHAEMVALRPQLQRNIRGGMRNSIDFGLKAGVKTAEASGLPGRFKINIGTGFIGADGKVRRFNPVEEAYKDSAWAKINADAMQHVLRFRPNGITLSQRVWDITWTTEKAIRRRIQVAVLTGESAARLSRDIRGFLLQPETLRGATKKAYTPGQGVYKSAYGNALRLSRTELGNAYTEGTIRYAKDKKWVTGWIWRTASGEPCVICQDYDGQFFPKDSAPPLLAHPNCYCYLETVTKETGE